MTTNINSGNYIAKEISELCEYINFSSDNKIEIKNEFFDDNGGEIVLSKNEKKLIKDKLYQKIEDNIIILVHESKYHDGGITKKSLKKIYLPRIGEKKITYKKILKYARFLEDAVFAHPENFTYISDDKYGNKIFRTEIYYY